MLKIGSEQIKKTENYIRDNCRPLEKVRFDFLFKNGNAEKVIEELGKFQNPDGGFGNGLESDFLLPDSSPLATSIALQFLDELPKPDQTMVKRTVGYLENTFDNKRDGWFTVPKTVNNYPHAPWWHWDEKKGGTVIDESWANPTAELIGYLVTYRKYLTKFDIYALIEQAINFWAGKTDFSSEHDIYCYIRLYNHLPAEQAKRLEPKLIEAAQKLVVYDPEKWKTYVPQPLQFAASPDFFLYEVVKEGIEANLDYLIETMTPDGVWEPNWTWHQYENVWPEQKVKWEGVIALQNLKILSAYGRLG